MLTTKQNNVVAVIQLINANQNKVVKGRGVLKLVCDACAPMHYNSSKTSELLYLLFSPLPVKDLPLQVLFFPLSLIINLILWIIQHFYYQFWNKCLAIYVFMISNSYLKFSFI